MSITSSCLGLSWNRHCDYSSLSDHRRRPIIPTQIYSVNRTLPIYPFKLFSHFEQLVDEYSPWVYRRTQWLIRQSCSHKHQIIDTIQINREQIPCRSTPTIQRIVHHGALRNGCISNIAGTDIVAI